ncbi:methyltransferase domain-containing protein [Micromonospora sp. NEAU-HG-1]|nr:methyltransferase domain-containing protein [Micromonospora rubida]
MPRSRAGWVRSDGRYSRAVKLEQVRRAYSSVAELYIGLFGTSQQVHADDLALIGRQLAGRPGTVLDLGCGPGHITDYLRSLGVDATGIDMVPEFIAHAQAAHPGGRYQLGSMEALDVADHSTAGILAWGSLIHLPPQDLDGVLAEFRRAMAPAGRLVTSFFVGDEVAAFDHKVVTAYRWPVDEFSERLARAGFTEVERLQRPSEGPHRPHAAIAAIATEGLGRIRQASGGNRHEVLQEPPVARRAPRRSGPRRSTPGG